MHGTGRLSRLAVQLRYLIARAVVASSWHGGGRLVPTCSRGLHLLNQLLERELERAPLGLGTLFSDVFACDPKENTHRSKRVAGRVMGYSVRREGPSTWRESEAVSSRCSPPTAQCPHDSHRIAYALDGSRRALRIMVQLSSILRARAPRRCLMLLHNALGQVLLRGASSEARSESGRGHGSSTSACRRAVSP